jgi:hypothetical protein
MWRVTKSSSIAQRSKRETATLTSTQPGNSEKLKRDSAESTFLASNWDYKNRIIPLRGYSPEMLLPVFSSGITVDFVYVDGSHIYEDVIVDLSAIRTLFPDSIISGDDWKWESVRTAVQFVANKHCYSIVSKGNTWILKT